MKVKECIFIIVIAIFFLILNIFNINASIGLSPATKTFNFIPNQSYSVSYQVMNVEEDQEIAVSAQGSLKDYVRFDKRNFNGSQAFTVYIDLPSRLESYGSNILFIVVSEVFPNEGSVSTRLSVGSRIYVNVQYPGKYAEIKSFTVSDTNENESIYFYLELNNRGADELEPSVDLEVYSKNTLLDKYPLGSKTVASSSGEIFDKTIDMNKYKAGNYFVKAYVTINDENRTVLTTNTTFRVGSLNIDIVNWTREVNKSKINPFNIEIESKWNHDLKNVYAEVYVTNSTGIQVDHFKTSPVELKKWEKAILSSYFNAENLNEGKYDANITLFYEDTSSSKSVEVKVIIPEIPRTNGAGVNILLIIGIIGLIIIIIAIILIVYFIKKNGKNIRYRR